MGRPITSKPCQTEYVEVKIRDAQNGVEKSYKFPDGTIFETTNHSYHISKEKGLREFSIFTDKDGEIHRGYKANITDNTIDVILPQYIAVDVFDVNNDNKIDYYDAQESNIIEVPEDVDTGGYVPHGDIIANEINDRLRRANSDFFAGGVGWSGVAIDKENGEFNVEFIDRRCISENNRYGDGNNKSLSIFLPQK